jgi:serine/threonine protein kinase
MRIIHRDVKPANVMVSSDGSVKLLDFGIATGSFEDRRARSLYNVAGTAGYDAPERRHLERGEESPGSDVYALGVTLFVLLTRKALLLAHEGEAHARAVQAAVQRIAPDGLAEPGGLRDLVAAMLSYEVADRPTMRHVADTLASLLRAGGEAPGAVLAAREPAQQAHASRRRRAVAGSPDHARFRFLEDVPSTPPPARLSEPEATARLRDLLSAPRWERRVTELQRLLDAAPGTVAGPFLSILDRARVSWWQFWVTPARPDEVEASLLVLCDHPAPDVVRRASQLATHPNERVAHAARYVLQRAARANS